MTIGQLLSYIFLLFFLSACTSTRAYHGPVVNSQELSRIKGFSNLCNGTLKITDFDATFSGSDLEALPGKHQMNVSYIGKPFTSDDTDTPYFTQCVLVSAHSVEFETKAGHVYWFYVDESTPGSQIVSVWESTDSSDQRGVKIPAKIEQNSIRRNCFLDDRYRECHL